MLALPVALLQLLRGACRMWLFDDMSKVGLQKNTKVAWLNDTICDFLDDIRKATDIIPSKPRALFREKAGELRVNYAYINTYKFNLFM